MRLLDLCIFRVRELEHLRLDFGDKQLVALLGANGSGKTTVLGCIIYLLTGEVIFKGGKDRMIRDVGVGDSWISGTIRQGDRVFKIKRFVSTSACELFYVSGGSSKPVKRPTLVQVELDAMGLTKEKVMRTLLEQGRYGGLFHSADGDRLRQMFEIFGLTETDEIQEAVGAEAALIPIDVTIEERWKTAADRRAAADLALQTAVIEKTAVGVLFERVGDARRVLAKAAEADTAAAELNTLRGGRAAVLKAVEAQAAESAGIAAEQAVLDAAVASMVGDAQAAEGVKAAMQNYRALAANVESYRLTSIKAGEAVQRHRAQLADLPAFIPGGTELLQADIDARRVEITKRENLVAAVQRLESVKVATLTTEKKRQDTVAKMAFLPGNLLEMVDAVEADHRSLREQVTLAKSGVCPTCKQQLPTAHPCLPLAQSEPMLAGCEAKRKELLAKKAELTTYKDAIAVCDTLLVEYAKQIAAANVGNVDVVALRGEIAALEQASALQRSQIATINRDNASRAEYTTNLAKADAEYTAAKAYLDRVDAAKVDQALYDAAVAVVALYTTKKASADANRAVLNSQIVRLATMKDELKAVEEKIRNFRSIELADPVAVDAARDVVSKSAEIEERWLAVNTTHGVAESEYRAAEQEFSTLDVLKKQNEANKRKHDLINDLKYLIGVKQFPMFVAGYYVQAINALWSQELGYTDSKFSAWQDETTLEFYATFHGSDKTRMLYQLSGGERQLAAVGYQVVINKLFAAGVDWIAFDEPTTHVDAIYRPKLVQAFLRMLQRSDLRDVQMFVVDHSAEFATAISDPIVLTKGE